MMIVSPSSERLTRVRHRFASSIENKIQYTYAVIPKLSGHGTDVADVAARSTRRIHDIVGVSPTVGFVNTGHAARGVENALIPAQSGRRGLNIDEIDRLKQALQALREI